MNALGSLPAAVLPGLLARAPLTPEKIAFAWGIAVGPAIARATDVTLRDGVLHVRADSAAWVQEMNRSSALILARLQQLLGRETVRSVTILGA